MAAKKLGFMIVIAIIAMLVIVVTLSTLSRHGTPRAIDTWSGLLLGVVLVTSVGFLARYYERRSGMLKEEMLIGTLLAFGLVGLVAAVLGEAAGSLAVTAWVFVLAWDVYMMAIFILVVFRSLRRGEQACE